jgi:hypothetical protein
MAHTRKAAILIIDELQEKLKNQDIALAKRLEWIRKVEAQNAALLAALRALVGHCTKADGPWLKVVRPSLDSVTQARAAIERNS